MNLTQSALIITKYQNHLIYLNQTQYDLMYRGEFFLKDYIAERVILLAQYVIDTKATVRQTAKKFGVSKFTVHTVRVT